MITTLVFLPSQTAPILQGYTVDVKKLPLSLFQSKVISRMHFSHK
jgi:hypothetical protein